MDFLEKLSSYNLFNYLLPGIIFAVIAEKFLSYPFIQQDIIIGLFVYYFIGLIISRFGSLLIEPALKKINFLKFSAYKDFVSASKKDPQVEVFSEANNTYRTFCSMFLLLLLLKGYRYLEGFFLWLKPYDLYILIGLLLILFLYSDRKQTNYITKRIEINKK